MENEWRGGIPLPKPGKHHRGLYALMDKSLENQIGHIWVDYMGNRKFTVSFTTDREIDLNATELVFVEEEA